MPESILDTFVTEFRFRTNRADLAQAERGANRVFARIGDRARVAARTAGQVATAFAAVGGAAFAAGAPSERAFIRLQTQLGLTAEEAEEARERMQELSAATGRGLAELGDAYFTLRSNGLEGAIALDIVREAAMGAAIELGSAATIANIAGSAINALGEGRAVEIILGTIKAGNIPDAATLAGSLGSLLPFAAELEIRFDELGAAIAGFSRTGKPVAEVVTSVRSALQSMLEPSSEAIRILDSLGLTVDDLRRMLATGGLLQTLRDLRIRIGDDDLAFAKLLGRVEALGFALHATGDAAGQYRDIWREIRSNTGDLEEAFAVVEDTGFQSATEAANEFRLALEIIYREAVVPILKAFNSLPETIRLIVVAVGAGGLLTQLLGLGPALAAIAGGAKAIGVAVVGAIAAVAGVPAAVVVAVAAMLAAVGYIAYFIWRHWEEIADRASAAWTAIEDRASAAAEAIGRVWRRVVEWFRGIEIADPFEAVLAGVDRLLDGFRGIEEWWRRLPDVGRWLPSWLGGDGDGVATAPVAPGAATAAVAGSGPRTANISINEINISVAEGDAEVIGGRIRDELREQLHDAAEDFDSAVAR